MRAILVVIAVLGTFALGLAQPGPFIPKIVYDWPVDEALLDSLLGLYRQLELPVPGKSAKVAEISVQVPGEVPEDPPRTLTSVALLDGKQLLIGPEHVPTEFTNQEGKKISIGVKPFRSMEGLQHDLHGWPLPQPFISNAELAMALQLHAIGEEEEALNLKSALKHPSGLPGWGSEFQVPHEGTPAQSVAAMALQHYANEICDPAVDRAKVVRQVRRLIAIGYPPKKLYPDQPDLLARFEATAKPNTAAKGSVEWAVNQLVNAQSIPRPKAPIKKGDEPYQAVVSMGLKALPVLAEHLRDQRFTRCTIPGDPRYPPAILTVGDAAVSLIGVISNGELAADREMFPKEDVLEWVRYKKLDHTDQFFLAHALPAPGKEAGEARGWPAERMVHALGRYYPSTLVGLYQTALARDDVDSYPIAWTIADCPGLTNEVKKQMYLLGSKSKNEQHRRSAEQFLAKYNTP